MCLGPNPSGPDTRTSPKKKSVVCCSLRLSLFVELLSLFRLPCLVDDVDPSQKEGQSPKRGSREGVGDPEKALSVRPLLSSVSGPRPSPPRCTVLVTFTELLPSRALLHSRLRSIDGFSKARDCLRARKMAAAEDSRINGGGGCHAPLFNGTPPDTGEGGRGQRERWPSPSWPPPYCRMWTLWFSTAMAGAARLKLRCSIPSSRRRRSRRRPIPWQHDSQVFDTSLE